VQVVYTYSENLVGNEYEQEKLLELWQESWRRRGWEPKIIGRAFAERHPRLSDFRARVRSFPTVNPRDYEDVCWLRWLAFAQVGGGLIVDADVINYSLRPESFDGEDLVSHDASGASGFVSASAAGAQRLVEWIVNFPIRDCLADEAGCAHLSDLLVIARYVPASARQCCRVYGWPRWFEEPCTHYANATLWRDFPHHRPKKAWMIRRLRAL
jgi:hypothetical protein